MQTLYKPKHKKSPYAFPHFYYLINHKLVKCSYITQTFESVSRGKHVLIAWYILNMAIEFVSLSILIENIYVHFVHLNLFTLFSLIY